MAERALSLGGGSLRKCLRCRGLDNAGALRAEAWTWMLVTLAGDAQYHWVRLGAEEARGPVSVTYRARTACGLEFLEEIEVA